MKLPPNCEPGRVLGHFTIGRALDDVAGASLAAFHSVDRSGQPVVVLVAPPRPASARTDFADMLERLKGLDHKAAPRILTGGMEDDLAWVALDAALFADGQTLEASVLREDNDRGGLHVVPTLLLMLDVCRVLRAAAQAGVHHGRLSLKSVLVAGVLLSAVLELGLAGLLGVERATLETAYAAPETLGCNVQSLAADVYAFGIVLHCALAGHLDPFGDPNDMEEHHNVTRMMLAARGQSPRLLADSVAGVPSTVDELIRACTAKDAARRPNWPDVERRLEVALSDAVRLTRDTEATKAMPASMRAREAHEPAQAVEMPAQAVEVPARAAEVPRLVEVPSSATVAPSRGVETSAADRRETLRVFVGGLLVVTGALTVAVVTLALISATSAAAPPAPDLRSTAPPEPPAPVVPASALTVVVQPPPPAPSSSLGIVVRAPAPRDSGSARARARSRQLYYWHKNEER